MSKAEKFAMFAIGFAIGMTIWAILIVTVRRT